jgi:chromosomal replication initiation ATPase DnaA
MTVEIMEPYRAPGFAYIQRRRATHPQAVCLVVEATVAASYRLPLTIFHAPNRCTAPVAFARQIAMYVAHVWLGLSLKEVGGYFGRDRTTVAHACHVVEERRENPNIDRMLSSIEAAVDLWLENGRTLGDV